MSAMPISWVNNPAGRKEFRANNGFGLLTRASLGLLVCLVIGLAGFTALAPAQDSSTHPQTRLDFAARAQKAYNAAKANYDAQTNNIESAWRFGVACYDWTDFATSSRQRAEIAQQGIIACEFVIQQDPKSVQGHYYLGMNFAQLAQTKSLGALKLVDQMEKEFTTVLELDASFDFAGSDRNLGLLYRDAPGWPASIGSRAKARQHLQQAAKLAPDYPENALNLLESKLKWGDWNGAARDVKALDDLWPKARQKLTGDQWASSWVDWDKRLDEVKKKISQPPTLKPNAHP